MINLFSDFILPLKYFSSLSLTVALAASHSGLVWSEETYLILLELKAPPCV